MGSVYPVAGSRFWYMKYYKDGRAVTESTGEVSKTRATKKLDRVVRAIAEGNWLSPHQRNVPVTELWNRLKEDFMINGQDVKRLDSQWKRIHPYFGHLKANQVTTASQDSPDAGLPCPADGSATTQRLRRAGTI